MTLQPAIRETSLGPPSPAGPAEASCPLTQRGTPKPAAPARPPSHPRPAVRCGAAGRRSLRVAGHAGTPQPGTPALRRRRGRGSSTHRPTAGEPPPSRTAARGAGEEEARGLPRTHLGGACARRGGRCHSHSAAGSSSAPPSCSGSGRLPAAPAATARPAPAPPRGRRRGQARGEARDGALGNVPLVTPSLCSRRGAGVSSSYLRPSGVPERNTCWPPLAACVCAGGGKRSRVVGSYNHGIIRVGRDV